MAAQEPTPVTNWDVPCPWCGFITLLCVRQVQGQEAFSVGLNCPACHKLRVHTGQAKDIDAFASAFMDVLRDEAHVKQSQNPDPLDTLRAITQTPKVITGSLKPSTREETGIIGHDTLPLSEELRAEVHQFYQESMTHARESGSLPYALSHAP